MAEDQAVKIRVVSGYRSANTNMQFIPEGDYAADDPALFGQSAFLLSSGRAVQLGEDGKPVTLTVQEGSADRDLSGKPIVVKSPPDQGILSNTIPPVYAQFPNNASASQVIQPYEINATEPAVVQEAAEKVAGNPSAKVESVARAESAATEAAADEAEAVRDAAAQTDGGDPAPFDDNEPNGAPTPENANDPFAGRNVDDLRTEVTAKELTVRDEDGNTVAVSKAKRDQLISALKNAG